MYEICDGARCFAAIRQSFLILRSFLVAVLLSLTLLIPVLSQDTVTGGFQGDVTDNRTGTPIVGARVTITGERTGVTYNLATDSKGVFFQGLLAPGFYQIRIAVPGFRERLLRREIRITATGEIVPVPVSMEPETTPTAAPTTAEEPDDIRVVINTTDARRSTSSKQEEVGSIPLSATASSRTFDELATLAPGIAPAPQTIGDTAGPGVGPGVGSAGQFAANGLRSRANNFTVDGSDNNDEDIGVRRQGFVALVPQPVGSIEEFSVITLLAPAQFGRNLGAQVNAVSRSGGNDVSGSLYGFLNSSKLNARSAFDSANGNVASPYRTSGGQAVLLDGQPITVRNQSGAEDPLTMTQSGGMIGGPFAANRSFFFFSGEYVRINALREKNFAVPTIEERGPFRTGASGLSSNPFTGTPLSLFPTGPTANAVFSLFPFPNDPTGIFGANTLTQSLHSGGRGVILSGRVDHNFSIAGRKQTITARYNFTDDNKEIPAVAEAVFSNIRSDIGTQNLSLFLNSDLNEAGSAGRLFNQLRFSFGHSRLRFEEIRNTDFLISSDDLPNEQFMLNAPAIFNVSLPQASARYTRIQPGFGVVPESTENVIGPVGQVIVAGFSPIGVDVYNFPQDRTNRTFQIADDVTFRNGDHTFVFGTDIRRTGLDSDLPRLARTLLTFNGAPRLVPSTGTCANGGIGDLCFLPRSDPRATIRPEDLVALSVASNSLLTLSVDRPGSRAILGYHQLNFFVQDTWRPRGDISISYGVRYEYNTPVTERNRLIEDTFTDPRLDLLPVLKNLISDRTSLYDPDRNNFAPRVGFAYSPKLFGTRVTVFRAGYGLFYDQILGAVANQSRNVFPTFLTVNFAATIFPFFGLTIDNPASATINGIPLRRPGTLNSYNSPALGTSTSSFADVLSTISGSLFANAINITLPSRVMPTPMAHHYSFSFEQQLSRALTFSTAYVGTTGRNLLRFTTPNLGSSLTVSPTGISQSPFATLPIAQGVLFVPRRPLDRSTTGGFESLGAVNQFETSAPSQYHSLQNQLRARFLGSFDAQISYTFSKATDEVSDVFDLAGAYVLPQDSFDLAAESGPANFDVRHRIAYDLTYIVPDAADARYARKLLNGLRLSTTGRYHSGQPFTVNSVIDVNLDGNITDRLDNLTGIEVTGDRRQPLRMTTANTTSLLAPFGQNGRIGRNSFRAGSVLELDVSIIKQFNLDKTRLAFRTDIFNIIDRANYGIPVRIVEAPGFGKAVNTVTPGRRVQFSLKYEF